MRQVIRSRWTWIGGSAIALVAAFFLWGAGQQVPVAHGATLADVQAQNPPGTTTYVVQPNDNLTSIAARFNTTVAVLLDLNNIVNPNVIRAGQELIVPAPNSTTLLPPPTNTPRPSPTAGPTATPTQTIAPTATASQPVLPPVTEVWSAPAGEIEVFSPVAETLYHSPIEIIGYSRTFEGNVNIRLLNADGEVIAERNAIGGSVDGFDFFHTYVRFFTRQQEPATLEVFEVDAATGEEINLVAIPITLLPGQRLIDVDGPQVGQAICNPIIVSGYSNTFEANVIIELMARDGTSLETINTLGGNLGIFADFFASPTYEVEEPQPLLVGAREEDASGLGSVDFTRIPVALYPGDNPFCQ